jgi:hypothetical protein
MPTMAVSQSYSLNGMPGAVNTTITDNLASNIVESIPAAQPSTLTTRTNNTVGTLTMTNSNHGIVNNQRVDFYWAGGQCYNVTVGTVSGTSVPFTTATALPVVNTVINVGIATQVLLAVTGNNLSGLLLSAPSANGYFVFDSSAPADLLAEFVSAGIAYGWFTGNGVTNPLAGGTVASIWMSHNNTAGAMTMSAGTLSH